MRADLLALATTLAARGEPFALATVVRREPPSSARVGDSALITLSGDFYGWLGGSCTQPTVLREARRAIGDGQPRLIAFTPDPSAPERPGVTPLPMTCHSGGYVDIYIEPVLPAPCLLVFGVSPTARALARIAKVLGYSVYAIDPNADATAFPDADAVVSDEASIDLQRRLAPLRARPAAVVATLGVRDEEALQQAVRLDPGYVGLIASRTRFGEMPPILEARGVGADALARIRCPAGLDVGAITPEEIALSIMAEIVQLSRTAPTAPTASGESGWGGGTAPTAPTAPTDAPVTTDPVCGMDVDPAIAKHRAERGGRTYLFCCGGCRERFLADPERYLAPTSAGHDRA